MKVVDGSEYRSFFDLSLLMLPSADVLHDDGTSYLFTTQSMCVNIQMSADISLVDFFNELAAGLPAAQERIDDPTTILEIITRFWTCYMPNINLAFATGITLQVNPNSERAL